MTGLSGAEVSVHFGADDFVLELEVATELAEPEVRQLGGSRPPRDRVRSEPTAADFGVLASLDDSHTPPLCPVEQTTTPDWHSYATMSRSRVDQASGGSFASAEDSA